MGKISKISKWIQTWSTVSAIFIGILILGSAHLPSSITKKPTTIQPLSQKLIAKYSRYQT